MLTTRIAKNAEKEGMKKIRTDKKVVLFGELMMRLSTKRHERLIQAREFDVLYSGAEANLGVGLIALGVDSFMVSSVPDNEGDGAGRVQR